MKTYRPMQTFAGFRIPDSLTWGETYLSRVNCKGSIQAIEKGLLSKPSWAIKTLSALGLEFSHHCSVQVNTLGRSYQCFQSVYGVLR